MIQSLASRVFPHGCCESGTAEHDDRTRARLLRAAVSVFDRKGYAATSVREIVELAGVTKPALYYHFGNKERLLVTILEEAARAFAAAVEGAVNQPGTTRDRLIGLAEAMHGLFQEHVPVVRVAHSIFFGPSEGAPAFDFTVFDRGAEDAVCRIVEDGRANGEDYAVSTTDVAVAVLGVITAHAGRQLHPGFEPLGVEDLRRVLGLVLDGVLVRRQVQGEPTQ